MLRSKITVEREKLCMFTCCRILYFIHSNVVQIPGSPFGIYKAVQKESSSVTGPTLLDVNPQRISNPGKDDSQDTLNRWWLHYSESRLLPWGLAWALWTILSWALCPFHNQYSSSLLLPRSFRPMVDLPRGLLLPWIQENISEGKGRQLLTHTTKEPSVEILPALSRTPSATACLQRDSLPIKLNFIKGSWRSSGLSLQKCIGFQGCLWSLPKPSSCPQLLPPSAMLWEGRAQKSWSRVCVLEEGLC